jgi:hypothetical protein
VLYNEERAEWGILDGSSTHKTHMLTMLRLRNIFTALALRALVALPVGALPKPEQLQNCDDCSTAATRFHLSDPPYENYFYSDCHSSSQVVITSPLPDSNLTIIGPRLLVSAPPVRKMVRLIKHIFRLLGPQETAE